MALTSPETNRVLSNLVQDKYLQKELPVDDQQLIHVANQYASEIDLNRWASESRDLVFLDLREKVRKETGCTAREAHQVAIRLERHLAYAVYRKADALLRQHAVQLLRDAASHYAHIASDPAICTEWLGNQLGKLHGEPESLRAEFEAMGLRPEEAAALVIHLKNRKPENVIEDLRSPGGLASHKGEPLTLERFRQGIADRVAQLKSLAASLPNSRDISMFESFPATAELMRGMARQMDDRSFLVHALESNEDFRRIEGPELANLQRLRQGGAGRPDGWTDRIMLDLANISFWSMIKAQTTGVILGVLPAAQSMHDLVESEDSSLAVSSLSRLSGAMSHEQYLRARTEAKRVIGRKIMGHILWQTMATLATGGL
jgi:hypothetical protein